MLQFNKCDAAAEGNNGNRRISPFVIISWLFGGITLFCALQNWWRVAILCAIATPLLALAAVIHILSNRRTLKGLNLSILALVISVTGISVFYLVIQDLPNILTSIYARNKLSLQRRHLVEQLKHHNEPYDLCSWSDSFVTRFDANGSLREKGISFALNWLIDPNELLADPNCFDSLPSEMVVFFETSPGWNQRGGPELFDNHAHYERSFIRRRYYGQAITIDGAIVQVYEDENPTEKLTWRRYK